jgi:uncharacterized YccA/Bax inhibitor family protein
MTTMNRKLSGYFLILVSLLFGLASTALIYQGVIHASGTLLAFGVLFCSLGMYVYSFSQTQIIKSTQELQIAVTGGFAAPRWISWLLSISSLVAGLMIATDNNLTPHEDWLVKFFPFLLISLLGALAATVKRGKK